MSILIFFLCSFLFCTVTHAGITFDMGMSTHYIIPEFKSEQQAIKFANQAKYIKALFDQMSEYEVTLRAEAYDSSKGWLGYGQKNFGNPWRDQWYRVNLCVRIMNHYRIRGIVGDPAQVGSSFMASSIPVKPGRIK